MGSDLSIKSFAKDNYIVEVAGTFGFRLLARVEPQFHPIEKLKAREVDERPTSEMISGTKEDGCCEDTPEAFDHATVVRSVFRQVEELENLSCAAKMDLTAFLSDG